ncbi:hypothetical protein D9M68_441140 [compost metagenome]
MVGQGALGFRDVDHCLAGAVMGQAGDDLAFGDHLATVHPHVGDHAVGVGPQGGVAAAVFHLGRFRGRGGLFGLGHPQTGAGLVVYLPGHGAGAGQAAVAGLVVAGLAQFGLGGGDAVARGAQGQFEVGVVQYQQHVALGHAGARVDLARDDLAADAKAQVTRRSGCHHAGIEGVLLDGGLHLGHQHGAGQGGCHCAVGLAVTTAQGQQGDGDQGEKGGVRTIHGAILWFGGDEAGIPRVENMIGII